MEKNIYIFGAHSRAQTLAVYLQYLYPNVVVEAYLYDNEEKNPEKIKGKPVVLLEEKKELHTDYPVWIGTRGVYHSRIKSHLKQYGFNKVIPVTVELDLQLRNEYFKNYFPDIGRNFVKIDSLKGLENQVAVYVAISAFDKPLKEKYDLAPYERKIQVGAELTKQRLSEGILTDDRGENISGRNKQFCELTALYWIWKHAEEEIVGLVHYRRHFILPEDWAIRMAVNNIDVILPIPLYIAPNLEENYKKRHDPADWEHMMDYLKMHNFQEYQEADTFFRGNFYSPCNMFIMRKDVLNRMCEWLFPILFEVARQGGEKEDSYLNRYPGFISERLITFFFERYSSKYKIAYSDKNFLF